jgi:hypothetical protein
MRFSPSSAALGRLIGGGLTGLFLCLLSLSGRAAGLPDPGDSPGRVYLVRGQGWVFSSGWRALRDRLREAGVRAEDLSDRAGDRVVKEVLADHQAGRLAGPIVFVGHSRGGRQSLAAAERLARSGVPVELILTTDVAVPPPVPAGVRRAVNLYLTHKRLYPARPLHPAPDSPAVVKNIDLNAADSPTPPRGLNHLNITDSPALQEYLFRQIMEVMRTNSGGQAAAPLGANRSVPRDQISRSEQSGPRSLVRYLAAPLRRIGRLREGER